MADFRESAFMPKVKCSQCGSQVEISMMGEHKCGSSVAAVPPQLSPSISEESFQEVQKDLKPSGLGRGPPPNLDTRAANQPFLSRGQLTPNSNSGGSRSLSPHTPEGRNNSNAGFHEPGIAPEDPVPSPRRPGGYGGFGASDNDSPFQQPLPSPSKPVGLLERMNTIAPGPFEIRGRQDSATLGEAHDMPAISASNRSASNASATMAAGPSANKPSAPVQPRKNGYGGFGPPSPSPSRPTFPSDEEFAPRPLGDGGRAGTFPRAAETSATSPGGKSPVNGHMRTPSMPGQTGRMLRDTSRPPPPQTSLVRPRTSGREAPGIDLAQEFGSSNPYHSANDSLSSGVSSAYTGSPSKSSSQSSVDPHNDPEKDLDGLMNDVQQSFNGMGMGYSTSPENHHTLSHSQSHAPVQQKGLMPSSQIPPNGSLHSSKHSPSEHNRLHSPQNSAGSTLQQPQGPSRRPSRDDSFSQSPQPSRPYPPRQGSLGQGPLDVFGSPRARSRQPSRDEYLGVQPQSQQPHPQTRSPMRTRDESSTPSPPRASPGGSTASPRSTASSSRGNCKSCTLPITGKSISSADGRLTGRYHKACFTCTTCTMPFTSGEFYVYSDRPYCERHYHKLNGSLCGRCGRGIEGQYLEDERAIKYHVNCFRCADCSRPLTDGYFEVEGRTYCERDALRRTSQRDDGHNSNDRNMGPIGPNGPQKDYRPGPRGPGQGQGWGPGYRGGPPPNGMKGSGPRGPGMGPPPHMRMPPNGPNGQQSSMGGRGGAGGPQQFVGLPRGQKVPPSQSGMAPPRPRMNKRMTRMGMM
ncbi:Transforming growth factor beta-1-induced transcript 1 protein [Ceratocystis fimbriata CBS 114723]|uniref:Transforming growth factor beta-1-induced transcript 1 protein n=1 Tax=Ceratocystis fimbriata CBS 114723 TaxID=1035309 RepID=A0A2C5WT36_9PEZI|nr:Transforming growth factor beta-1-induced transcript 1 protein [Ceratocystis fimbriata CBS 114723]